MRPHDQRRKLDGRIGGAEAARDTRATLGLHRASQLASKVRTVHPNGLSTTHRLDVEHAVDGLREARSAIATPRLPGEGPEATIRSRSYRPIGGPCPVLHKTRDSGVAWKDPYFLLSARFDD